MGEPWTNQSVIPSTRLKALSRVPLQLPGRKPGLRLTSKMLLGADTLPVTEPEPLVESE